MSILPSDMLQRERQTVILDRLRSEGRVIALTLAREFGTSEDTIRRDLRELAAAGLCERVYGGALQIAPRGTPLSQRIGENRSVKTALARTAAALVQPRTTIFIDASSTNLEIARAIPDGQDLTVATNAPVIATALMDRNGIDVILIGGKIDPQVGAAVGAKAQKDVASLRPHLCILGACGIDEGDGLTCFSYDDAEFKRTVATLSGALVIGITSDKIGLRAPHVILPLASEMTFVVEHDLPQDRLFFVRESGAQLLYAEEVKP